MSTVHPRDSLDVTASAVESSIGEGNGDEVSAPELNTSRKRLFPPSTSKKQTLMGKKKLQTNRLDPTSEHQPSVHSLALATSCEQGQRGQLELLPAVKGQRSGDTVDKGTSSLEVQHSDSHKHTHTQQTVHDLTNN